MIDRDWLQLRSAGAAPALAERVRHHAAGAPEGVPLPAALAAAGDAALALVVRHPGDRSAALDLLAADALITLALLAQAEAAPERLGSFAEDMVRRHTAPV